MSERLELRIPASVLARWRVTAALHGISLSEWIRRTCNQDAVDDGDVKLLRGSVR